VSKAKPHRLFFALNPGERVRAEVHGVQKSLSGKGRAVPPVNFHVTLAFLGMQQPEVIPRVCEIASNLTFRSCAIVLDQLGQFRKAGVIWLGASRVPDALVDFQQTLVDALLEAGIGYDRKPWKCHLTLYRKMRMPPRIMDPIEIKWRLNGFRLIESVSVNNGVEYHSMGHWKARL
jgi:2'-5' RNA ligase